MIQETHPIYMSEWVDRDSMVIGIVQIGRLPISNMVKTVFGA